MTIEREEQLDQAAALGLGPFLGQPVEGILDLGRLVGPELLQEGLLPGPLLLLDLGMLGLEPHVEGVEPGAKSGASRQDLGLGQLDGRLVGVVRGDQPRAVQ